METCTYTKETISRHYQATLVVMIQALLRQTIGPPNQLRDDTFATADASHKLE